MKTMKYGYQSFGLLLATLLLAVLQPALAAEDRGLLLEARKGEQTVYLLGSIHLADDTFYPLRQEITQAYNNSDALVVEADILKAESDMALQQQIMTESLYPAGDNLKNHISADIYQQLQQWLKQRNIPEPMFNRQRPAIAMMALSMVEMQLRGLNPQLGIDRHFLSQAHKSQKPILELESVLEQLRMLNSLQNPDLYLKQTLEQLAELDDFVPRMKQSWKSGDIDDLYQLVIAEGLEEHPEFAPLYDALFFQRNRTMANTIQQMAKDHQTLFVIVGAGHLVGKKSVTELLQKQGYQITQR